jgi:hypothetical protein
MTRAEKFARGIKDRGPNRDATFGQPFACLGQRHREHRSMIKLRHDPRLYGATQKLRLHCRRNHMEDLVAAGVERSRLIKNTEFIDSLRTPKTLDAPLWANRCTCIAHGVGCWANRKEPNYPRLPANHPQS